MNPGFRYHVTTIAAIFLALGVGIMIGSSFVQSQIVDRQTKRLEELGAQFNRDIAPLRESNRNYGAFLQQVAATITENKLTGIRVAIVQTGDYPDTMRIVRQALERAGAQVENETVITSEFPTRAPESLTEVAGLIRPPHSPPTETTHLIPLLALGIAKTGHKANIDALQRADLIETNGDYTRPVSFVVLVGGASVKSGARTDSVDIPLVQALKPLINTVIAVEPLDAEISYVEALRGAGIATVDNADTDIGQIAMVLAIQGPPGEYGVKPTARSGMIPPQTLR